MNEQMDHPWKECFRQSSHDQGECAIVDRTKRGKSDKGTDPDRDHRDNPDQNAERPGQKHPPAVAPSNHTSGMDVHECRWTEGDLGLEGTR